MYLESGGKYNVSVKIINCDFLHVHLRTMATKPIIAHG